MESLHTSQHGIYLSGKQKANREFLSLTLMETTNISLAGSKPPMTPKHAVVWTMLKKASHHINSFIRSISFFFSSAFRSPKSWGLVLLQRDWISATTVLHPPLLPSLLMSSTSPRAYETSSANSKVFMARSSSICHPPFWTLNGHTAVKPNKGHWFHKSNSSLDKLKNTCFPC